MVTALTANLLVADIMRLLPHVVDTRGLPQQTMAALTSLALQPHLCHLLTWNLKNVDKTEKTEKMEKMETICLGGRTTSMNL